MSIYLNNKSLIKNRQRILLLLYYCYCCLYLCCYGSCYLQRTNCLNTFADAYQILPQQSRILLPRKTTIQKTTTTNIESRIRTNIVERMMNIKQHDNDIIMQQQQQQQQQYEQQQQQQHVESIATQSNYNNNNRRRDFLRHSFLTMSTITSTTLLSRTPCWAVSTTTTIVDDDKVNIATARTTTTTTTTTKNIPRTVTIEPLIPAIYIRNQLRIAQRITNEWNTAIITTTTETTTSNTNQEEVSNSYVLQLRTLFDPPPLSNDKIFSISRPTIITSQESIQRYNNAKNYVETKFTYDCSTKSSSGNSVSNSNSNNNSLITSIPLNGLFIRYSCNVYTANIRYGDTYVLTADPIKKKELIRSDALPDITTVITSDLDLRDLYRNQLQTLIDDIQAEIYRPLQVLTNNNNNSNTGPDTTEVTELLINAIQTIDKWLALVPIDDINKGNELLSQLLYTSSIQTTCTKPESSNKIKNKNNSIRLLQLPYPY